MSLTRYHEAALRVCSCQDKRQWCLWCLAVIYVCQLGLPRSLSALAWQLKEAFSSHLSSFNTFAMEKNSPFPPLD